MVFNLIMKSKSLSIQSSYPKPWWMFHRLYQHNNGVGCGSFTATAQPWAPQTVGRHPVTSGLFAHLLEQIESIVKEKPCALDLRERSHIPHLEQENHLQKYLGSRYVIIPRRAFFFLSKHTRPAEWNSEDLSKKENPLHSHSRVTLQWFS